MMKRRTFGKTGLEVSPLGFSGAPIAYLNEEQDKSSRILNLLLDAGLNVVDTAASYPGGEVAVGKAVGHRRDDFVLISKCGGKLPDLDLPAWSAEMVTATIERSLKNLSTDRLDVMLLHSCDRKTLEKGEALAALIAARDAGKVRFVGYSGDNDAAAFAAGLPEVSVIQTSINIADQINIDMVLQNISVGSAGTTDITFTLSRSDGPRAMDALKAVQAEIGFADLILDDSVGKVSLVGAGMRNHPGVTATFCEALSDAGINIETMNTSEIRISVIVDETQVDAAVQATHTAFELDADEVEAVVYGGTGR